MCVSTRSLTQPFLPTDDLSKAIFPEASIEFFARGEQAFHGPSSGGFYQKTLFTLRERGKLPQYRWPLDYSYILCPSHTSGDIVLDR